MNPQNLGLNQFLQPLNSPITGIGATDGYQFDYQTERGAVRSMQIQDAAITNAKIGTAAIGTANIGTLSFNEISGGTATLGGTTNGDGLLIVNNAAGSQIVSLNNTGISVTGGSISVVNASGSTIIDTNGLVGTNNFITAQAGKTDSSTTTTSSTTLVDIPDCTNASFQISRSRMMLAILTCELLFQSADTGVEAYIHISGDVNDIQEPRISLIGSKYNATGTGDFITLTTYVFRLITANTPPTTYVIKGQWKVGSGATATIRNRQLSYYLLGS